MFFTTDSSVLSTSRYRNDRRGNGILILILLLLLIGAGFATYQMLYSSAGNSLQDDPLTETVIKGPFDHIVLEQGEVESSSNIEVVCEVKAKGTSGTPILWVIEEGAYVKKGDKLVELDKSAFEDEIANQRIYVSGAEATVISSEALVKTAQISLQEYLEGTYLSERKTLLSDMALAEQNLRKAELNLASAERMAAKGLFKSLQIEAEEFAVANARNLLESAQAKLKVLDELTRQKMEVQLTSDIESARAKLGSDKSVLAEEQEKLREIERQIEKCIIYSPADGVVVYANVYSSRGGSAEFVVEEGSSVRERQTIIRLPDPSKMQVKAKVNESRIALIHETMPAIINVSAVEGDLMGRVKRVNKYAEPGSYFSSSVKEYATFVEIIDPPENIRTGMTAEVRIFVQQLQDALQIPVHGLYEFKKHHFCLKKVGEDWETVEVKIGATNDKMVTVQEGLSEGDVIALSPRNFLDLMKLPEIADIPQREEMAEMSKNVPPPTQSAGPPGGPRPGGGPAGGGGPGGGGPGGGGPGGGGPGGPGGGPGGGFNPRVIADQFMDAADTDKNGKASAEELAALDEQMRERAKRWDGNGDGTIEKAEIIKVINERMKQRAAEGGGGPGGPGGPGGGSPGGAPR